MMSQSFQVEKESFDLWIIKYNLLFVHALELDSNNLYTVRLWLRGEIYCQLVLSRSFSLWFQKRKLCKSE